MKITNAIKKLEKAGFEVKLSNYYKEDNFNKRYIATQENNIDFIEVLTQGDEVSVIDLRTRGQEDDIMSDYHAGTFCDNISQAIRLATN